MSRRILCAMVVPLALLGGCGSGGENGSGAPSGEEASPAETQAAPAAGESAAPEAVASSEAPAPSPAATATASPAPRVAQAPAAPAAAAAPVAPPPAFVQCRACHTTEPGKNAVGPSLAGVAGRKAGSVPGFNYSAALKGSGITWNAAALDQWLAAPMKMVPGTRMVISVPDAARRQQIVEYLATLK